MEDKNEPRMITWFDHENDMVHLSMANQRMSMTNHRLTIALIAVCLTVCMTFIITILVFVHEYTERQTKLVDTLMNKFAQTAEVFNEEEEAAIP